MSDWKDVSTENEPKAPTDRNTLSEKGMRAMQGFDDSSMNKQVDVPNQSLPEPNSPVPNPLPLDPAPPPPEHTPKSAFGDAGDAKRVGTSVEKSEVQHFSPEGYRYRS